MLVGAVRYRLRARRRGRLADEASKAVVSRLSMGLGAYGQRMRVLGVSSEKHGIVSWGWFPMTRIKQVVGYGASGFLLPLSLGKIWGSGGF